MHTSLLLSHDICKRQSYTGFVRKSYSNDLLVHFATLTLKRSNFLAGAKFDVRVEVHGEDQIQPDTDYSLSIRKLSKTDTKDRKNNSNKPVDFTKFTKVQPDAPEAWNFSYFKDAAAYWKSESGDKNASTTVNVASSAWRNIQLREPGTYEVLLKYQDKASGN